MNQIGLQIFFKEGLNNGLNKSHAAVAHYQFW